MCNQSQNIVRYHDGELPPEEVKHLELHLVECPSCRRDLYALRALSRSIVDAPLPQARAEVMEQWMSLDGARATARSAQDAGVRRLAGWLSSAAAVLLVGASLLSVMKPSSNNDPSTALGETVTLSEPVAVALDSSAVAMNEATDQSRPLLLAAHLMAADLRVEQAVQRP